MKDIIYMNTSFYETNFIVDNASFAGIGLFENQAVLNCKPDFTIGMIPI
jgi:hypothetical protein